MAEHPIDDRYANPEMLDIWGKDPRWNYLLKVEGALAYSLGKNNFFEPKLAKEIISKANTKHVKIKAIEKIEDDIGHDVMAMIKALKAVCTPDAGRWVHYGATSSDILDTATALQFKDSVKQIKEDLIYVKKVLIALARKTKDYVCVERTHGQQAIPTTYGFRFANFAQDISLHLKQLKAIEPDMTVGQMSGAVGTGAGWGDEAEQVEIDALDYLGLEPILFSFQIIPRERHASLLLHMALIASTLEKISTDIRTWQRSEIGEVSEKFGEDQVGSSTMAQKKNPVSFENISGLSRQLAYEAPGALQHVPLWEGRDLTNSAAERILFRDKLILIDYLLRRFGDSMSSLQFNKKRMIENLELKKGIIMSEAVMLALTKEGMNRQEAHELVRKISQSLSDDKHFRDALIEHDYITKYLIEKEIRELMEYKSYIGRAKNLEKSLKKLEKM